MFIEKPKKNKVKQIIKKKGYWNSGMFYMTKESIINNFKKYDKKIYKNCNSAVLKSKYKNNIYYLNKQAFSKIKAKSFDYAILEKTKKIFAIKLNIPWSDLGSWKEICKMYKRNKKKYFDKKNVFKRPWGNYVNLFNGNEFLIKELNIKPKRFLKNDNFLLMKNQMPGNINILRVLIILQSLMMIRRSHYLKLLKEFRKINWKIYQRK